jgi:hypothetical protein
MPKIKWLITVFFLFAILGYWREFFFVHINNIMFHKYHNSQPALPIPDIMYPFTKISYNALYYSKYPYTLIWTCLFFAANYFALKKLTSTPFLIKILFFAYLIILLLAAFAMGYGYFINERFQNDEYTLSRWLLGIAQSPLICLILLASEKLYKKSFQS